MLYELLTGEPPHMGQIIVKIVTENVQSVTELRKLVPVNVVAAAHKLGVVCRYICIDIPRSMEAGLTPSGRKHTAKYTHPESSDDTR